ncbi:DUF6249 domain-containing protein [Cellvibrio fibrivorans]|uniref:DUF6249 domain-containing protein n=1 Tax=Cellvibrio fibrivorans TaxID=126350 RepID=A0ABU1UZB4_9GAMM|nr:DUF6249 domain-containing protein [Cellvibrio fibrivorans]MDR7090500.1 hypothetical protein [Cellvibrio fibrivorans]
MTLFLSLPRRLMSAFGLALVCAFPVAYSLAASAAELEGTVVTVDGSAPVQVQVDAPQPASAPASPDAIAPEQPPQPPSAEDHERWKQDNERWKRDNERWVRDNQNWERDWEKNLSQAFGGDHEDDGDFHPALLIPLFAILFIFGGPILLLILILVFFFGAKRRRQQDINMNIDKLLAAGRDIPVELLRGDEPRRDEPVGSRDKGIRNIFLGTGWLVFLTIMVGFDIGSAGFIWIALGASQVVIWYLNRPNASEQAGQQD